MLSWVRVVVSWVRLGASCERLGSILGSLTSPSRVFNLSFHGFGIRFEPWELQKSLIFIVFSMFFFGFRSFNINVDFGWILVPTWLHFGAAWAPKTRLGNVLGHLGGVMGACWGVLGASWSFLGASWGVLGAS